MAPLPLSSISRALGVMGFPGTQIFFLLLFFILPLSFVGDLYQRQQILLEGIDVYVFTSIYPDLLFHLLSNLLTLAYM